MTEEKPKHEHDYLDCFHRNICWEVAEYGECCETPCEDYVKCSDVVVKKQ